MLQRLHDRHHQRHLNGHHLFGSGHHQPEPQAQGMTYGQGMAYDQGMAYGQGMAIAGGPILVPVRGW